MKKSFIALLLLSGMVSTAFAQTPLTEQSRFSLRVTKDLKQMGNSRTPGYSISFLEGLEIGDYEFFTHKNDFRKQFQTDHQCRVSYGFKSNERYFSPTISLKSLKSKFISIGSNEKSRYISVWFAGLESEEYELSCYFPPSTEGITLEDIQRAFAGGAFIRLETN